MSAATRTHSGQAYLDAVELELSDLPQEERTELLEDLALHLAELEEEGDERTLESRLGSSADYARELRVAAGLPLRTQAPRVRSRHARRLTARAWRSAPVVEARQFLPTLAPAWWLLRGYLVVLLPCLHQVNGRHDFPVPSPYGNRPLGVALVLIAMAVSVTIGRRRLPRALSTVVILLNVALAALAVNVAATAPARLAVHSVRIEAQPDPSLVVSPLATRNGPVTNIFPFSANGTPLSGVLLYDQDGRPLYVGKQLWFPDHCVRITDPPLAKDGVAVPQSYPQRYVVNGSGLTLSGTPITAGQCKAVATPKVNLPAMAP